MIGKNVRKIMQQLLLMFYVLRKNISCVCFKTQLKSWKTSCFLSDSKRKKMTLSYSKKVISIIKRNNLKNNGVFFSLSFLLSFTTKKQQQQNKKQNKKQKNKTNLNDIKTYVKINIFVMYFCLLKRPKY